MSLTGYCRRSIFQPTIVYIFSCTVNEQEGILPLRPEVEQAVRNIIVETLMLEDVPPESLSLHDEDFLTALGANSIDILELMISVEEHFNFEFGDDQLRPDLLRTLDQFVSATCHRIALAEAASGRDGQADQRGPLAEVTAQDPQ
jgi:acyl carrier protein